MPTLQFECPLCQKQYRAYVDHSTIINCNCGTSIKPNEDGSVNVADTKEAQSLPKEPKFNFEAQNQPNPTITQPVNEKKEHPILTAIILGTFALAFIGTIVGSFMDWYTKRNPQPVNVTIQPPYGSSHISSVNSNTTAPPASNYSPERSMTGPLNTENDSIVYVHILNTFQNTNKHVKSIWEIDETTKTSILTAIENPKSVIKMIMRGPGVVNVQFINNGKIETNKIFFRRSDLENKEDFLVYTSRTGEITITLTY